MKKFAFIVGAWCMVGYALVYAAAAVLDSPAAQPVAESVKPGVEDGEKVDHRIQNLDVVALRDQMGYATAEQQVLQGIAQQVSSDDMPVQTPVFLGISSHDIAQFIVKYYPTFYKDWQQFLQLFGGLPDVAFMQQATNKLMGKAYNEVSLSIPPKAQAALASIHDRVVQVFSQRSLFDENADLQKQAKALIASLSSSTSYIKVLVSDKRTRLNDQLVNDTTEFWVQPDLESISDAIGKCVASVVSLATIQERIKDLDPMVFYATHRAELEKLTSLYVQASEPFFAVCLQENITEPVVSSSDLKDDIPTAASSGTIVTRQFGGARDVVYVESVFGYGLGLTLQDQFSIAFDRMFITKDGDSSIRNYQQVRAIPYKDAQGVHVGLAPIPYDAQGNPSVDSKYASSLRAVANRVSLELGKRLFPVDNHYIMMFKPLYPSYVDFVIKDGNIYITQMRKQLLYATPKPAYIDFYKQQGEKTLYEVIGADNMWYGQTLCPGDAGVHVITDASQVVTGVNADDAWKAFVQVKDPTKIVLVVLQNVAALTSASMQNLQSVGVPVLVAQEHYKDVQDNLLLVSESQPAVVDTQQGVLFLAPSGFQAQQYQVNGYASYPTAVQVTVPSNAFLALYAQANKVTPMSQLIVYSALIKDKVQETLAALQKMQTSGMSEASLFDPVKKLPLMPRMHAYLEMAGRFGAAIASQALYVMITDLFAALQTMEKSYGSQLNASGVQAPLEFALVVYALADYIGQEGIDSLQKDAAGSLERWYVLQPMRAMLFQRQDTDLVSNYSIYIAINDAETELQKVSQEAQKQKQEAAVQAKQDLQGYISSGQHALTEFAGLLTAGQLTVVRSAITQASTVAQQAKTAAELNAASKTLQGVLQTALQQAQAARQAAAEQKAAQEKAELDQAKQGMQAVIVAGQKSLEGLDGVLTASQLAAVHAALDQATAQMGSATTAAAVQAAQKSLAAALEKAESEKLVAQQEAQAKSDQEAARDKLVAQLRSLVAQAEKEMEANTHYLSASQQAAITQAVQPIVATMNSIDTVMLSDIQSAIAALPGIIKTVRDDAQASLLWKIDNATHKAQALVAVLKSA